MIIKPVTKRDANPAIRGRHQVIDGLKIHIFLIIVPIFILSSAVEIGEKSPKGHFVKKFR